MPHSPMTKLLLLIRDIARSCGSTRLDKITPVNTVHCIHSFCLFDEIDGIKPYVENTLEW